MKTQIREYRKTKGGTALLRAMTAVGLLLFLQGCRHFPQMQPAGMQYKPLMSDIAAAAAPVQAPVAPSLYCRADKGMARFSQGWADHAATDFTLPSGARVTLTIQAAKARGAIDVMGFFDQDGQKLIFCPVLSGAPDRKIACASLYALDDDLQMGIKRTFDIPDAVRGGSVTCAFDPKKLKSL